MAGRRDIKAGKSFVTLSLKNNLSNALRAVQKRLEAFARAATKLGGDLMKVDTFISGPLLAAGLASEKVRDRLTEAKDTLAKALEPVV
jgi:ABC-type transporter Mla subunit MlaD